MNPTASRKSSGIAVFRRATGFNALVATLLMPGLTFWTSPTMANPRGGTVVHGDVNIGSGAGGNLQIRQNSRNAIINWDSFSIDAGELTQFRQTGSAAAVLNRVTGGDPSAIHGALKANGNVFVINPNGILVGPGGTIDVHGLVLSTLDISNGEFLAGGDMVFKGSGDKGVTNLGRINAVGGDVFLIGKTVSNSGSVSASSGRVGLAAGEEVLLTAAENTRGERIFVRASGSGVSGTGIYNDGTIEGAAVEMKAHGNIYALAINNKGSVRATGATNSGGRVFLNGAGGTVSNSGSIRATSSGGGNAGRVLIEAAYAKVDGMIRAQGGNVRISATERAEVGGTVDVSSATGRGGGVVVEGREIQVGSGSLVDASGETGGGNVRIGGGFQGRDTSVRNAESVRIDDGALLRGDAIGSGSGGNLIVWSDVDTVFAGDLSARGISQGGFAEISGKETLSVEGDIDLTAVNGPAGTLLLDPTNITISATGASVGPVLGGSTISNVWLSNQLDAGNNVVISTNFGGAEAGNITVGRTDNNANAQADRILWYQDSAAVDGGTLTLLATGNIFINTAIQSAGKGGVNIVAGWNPNAVVNGSPNGGWSGPNIGASAPANDPLTITFDIEGVLATMNDGNPNNNAAGNFNAVNNANGSVFLGATNARTGVAVGSRWGDTNLAAHDLIMRGSTTVGHGWAQIGFSDNGVEYDLSRSHNGLVLNEWWGAPTAAPTTPVANLTHGNPQNKNYIERLGGTEFGTGDTLSLGTNAFRGAGWGAAGNIDVALSGRLDARSGTTNSHVQIGHGGTLRDGSEWKRGQTITDWGGAVVSPGVLTDAITTRDGITIDPGDGRRSFFASTWRTNYAGDAARISGTIKVETGGDVLLMAAREFDGLTDMQTTSVYDGAYALIGHGGAENQGSFHGDVSVIAHGVTSAPTGAGNLNNGLAGLGIQVLGGRGTRTFAGIGHLSGYEGNRISVWDQTRSGNIVVDATAGAIRLQAHNQAIRDGNINTGALIGADTPTPISNGSDESRLGSFVQIGHGGQNSSLSAANVVPTSGPLTGIPQGFFAMPGGTNINSIVPDSSAEGSITVTAAGTYVDPENADTPIGILVRAGNRRWQHAMIGHGGTNHNAINTADIVPDFGAGAVFPILGTGPGARELPTVPYVVPTLAASTGYNGNIRVEADKGSIIATGGDNFRADRVWGYGYNFVQVGHGGDVVRGNKGGTITVLAGQGGGALSGDIKFQAGRMLRDHAMLGHGGLDSDGDILGAANSAEIVVTARGGISFISPPSGEKDALGLSTDYAYWWFSNASAAGTPQTGQPGFWSTEDRFVQLGHGGYASTTVMPNRQDITVTSGTGDANNADGDASTGGITFIAGDMERDYAQLGHGGHSAGANNADGFTGDITVNALGGAIRFDASILGAQGVRRATDRSLNGIANATTTVGYGGGYEAYAQLGHGGYGARGVNVGNIVVNAWGGLDFLAALAAPVVDHSVTTAPIDAAINAGTNVWVQLAGIRDPLATPSTLSFQTSGILSNVIPGTIRIELEDGRVITDISRNSSDDRTTTNSDTSPNGLFLDGVRVGETNYDWGLIRFNNSGPLVGNWTPGTAAVATFQTAQGLKERAYVQLGHGGYEADGPNNKANDILSNSGDITILAGGDIRFQAGAAHRNHAQLGHGGLDTKGISSGNITIDHISPGNPLGQVGGIRFLAGHGGHRQYDYQSYAQLGHGGYEADGNHFGNIFIRGTQDADGMGLFFKAGDLQDSYVQLGHGGRSARTGTGPGAGAFGLNGDIDIATGGDVAFVAGTYRNINPAYREDGRLYAMLGHGGWDSDPTPGGEVNFGQGRLNPALPTGTAGAGEGSWGHFGDITLVTSSGNISFMAGSNIPVSERLDLDGNPLPMPADPNGFLTSHGAGLGIQHFATLGHGGYATSGDHYGNITVVAQNGGVHVVGGMLTNDNTSEKRNYAQIGHGGGEAFGHLGRRGETVRVHALGANGDILVAAGGGNRTQAMIGNGGVNYDGTHLGDIEVYAGRHINLRGGIALERVVGRVGEFQDMIGADGGHPNDISEFNGYYGSGGLGYVMMDEAAFAGNGARSKLIGDQIQPGTVEFRLAIATPVLFDAAKEPEYIDDGNGNIVEKANPSNIVGTINYASGEVTWNVAILSTDVDGQPDLFINYRHRTGIRNDAIYANATIGHGGYASNSRTEAHPEAGGGFVNRGHLGNIDVRAGVDASGNYVGNGGSITAIAGNDQRTYVQIGHGGMDSTAPANHVLSGDITTMADGTITFRGGGGLIDNQHIDFNRYGPGNTEVVAVTTAHNAQISGPDVATTLLNSTRSNAGINDIVFAFAHIGHGGVTVHANNGLDNNQNDPLAAITPETGHNGDIFVGTNNGNIDFTGGGVRGYGHFAMIGHGGYSVHGNHYGDINVASGADINFTGGGNTYRGSSTEGRNFVQIGHGGRTSVGNLLGEITVDAVGAINFQGGDSQSDRTRVPYGAHVYVLNAAGNQDENHFNRSEGRLSRAQIGHGGDQVFGDKTGNIIVTAGNGINFRGGDRLEGSHDNNAGYLNFAMIGHGGWGSWRQYRVNNTVPALPATAGAADDWNLPFWWDPVGNQYVFDGTFGPNGDGQFFWSVDNSINAAIGLGNPLYDGFGGNVTVTATGGDIFFQGGTSVGTFAKIGHGGVETGGDHNGDLTVSALNGDIHFNSNRIEETGSTSAASYGFTQIGHGGAFSSGEQSGKIEVSASGEIRFKGGRHDSFAMIGHGGRESHSTQNGQVSGSTTYRRGTNFLYSANTIYRPGTRTGDISVVAGGDIAFVGGNLNGDRAFTQIGHGGFNIHANPDPNSQFGDGHSGAINVVSTDGSILLKGGDRANAHAQIGHGGTESFGNHGGDGGDNRADSDILVEAKTGIRVMATGRFDSNNVARNFAQIGHGGWRSSFRDAHDIDANLYAKLQPYTGYTNPITGLVNVDDAGLHPLTPFTTNTDGLGMGPLATLGTFKGDITVRTTGVGADIRFIAPDASEGTLGVRGEDSYVQLGHGGWRNFADIEGNITVESGGELEFRALQGAANAPNVNTNHNVAYAQLGHGGFEGGGTFTGNISVTAAGSILFRGADSVNGANVGYAQLGHGGYNTSKASAQYREAIRNPVTGVAPAAVFSPVGNIGFINVTSGGDIEFLAGRDFATYVQLGHGGYISQDTSGGDITVTATGGIRFVASIDNHDPAGDNPGTNTDAHAQLGHGGRGSHGSHYGDITVTSGQFGTGHAEQGRGLVFRSGDDERNYSQLGHGGYEIVSYGLGANAVGLSGDITVNTDGGVLFVAGTLGGRNLWDNTDGFIYTQLGHGGYNSDVAQDRANLYGFFDVNGNPVGHNGDIAVRAGGSVEFLGGDTKRAYEPSPGDNTGRYHYAQLGHGGRDAVGNHWGDIRVQAGIADDRTVIDPNARILFASGSSTSALWADHNSYAQLGHGGRDARGDQGRRLGTTALDTITVMSGGDITFTAEASGVNSYVMLGNGGAYARGDHAANIQVYAERDIAFVGGMMPQAPGLGNGFYNQYSYAGIDANAQTRSLDWAANLHTVDTNPNLINGVAGRVNINFGRVIDGSIRITIRDNSLNTIGRLVQQGNHLITESAITADFGTGAGVETIPAGTIVADIGNGAAVANGVSVTGTTHITFLRDMNPGANGGTANLAIEFEHASGNQAWAMLGNGGFEADQPDGNTALGNMGNISVVARAGNIGFNAGSQNDNYAHLGHGGRSTRGANYGNIVARAGGSLDFVAGVNASPGTTTLIDRAYVQIGHGGWDADGNQTGDIILSAGSGQLFTSLSHTKGDPSGWFDDLGDFDGDGNADEIRFATANAADGTVRLIGGAGNTNDSWTQIGHGGRDSSGPGSDLFTGRIGVSATGDIDLLAGTGSRDFVQIGHGGWDESDTVNISGDISVITEGGNLSLKARGFNSYALIGHGGDDDNKTTTTGGTRQGAVFALGDHITLDRNGSSTAWIGHQFRMSNNEHNPFGTQNLANAADNLGGGFQVIGRSGLSYMNNGALQGGGTITITDNFRDNWITPNLKDGNFAFTGGNLVIDTVIDSTTSYALGSSHGHSVTFLAAGDIDVNRRISSPGAGAVNLIAGANLAAASLWDAPSKTGGISGTNLNFQRIDHLWHVPHGYINMEAVRNDSIQWGNANGFSIASGEFFSAAGEISIDAINNGGNFNLGVGSKDGETNALGHGVRLIGGNSDDEYAQLGFKTDANGDPATGDVWVAAKEGGILVQSGTAARSSSQIGHGGNGGNVNVKNLSGSISARADGGAIVGNVSVLSGTGDTGHAQIGHGGRQNDGSHSGDILVIGEALTVTSAASVAQIGHGGFQGTGAYSGNLFINYDPLANGGLGAAVGGGGALTITAGNGFDDYAQIGHGGVVATTGNRTGDIIVGQSASVTLQGGTNKSTSAQLGHGGVGAGAGTLTGNIEINTTGNVSVLAGASVAGQGSAFAQIGHGGTGAAGAKTGNITINALGTQITVAGPSTAVVSSTNYAQIGHGGDASGGTLSGNIAIDAPNAGLNLTAGNQARAFAKVGHGGYNSGGAQSGTIGITLGGAVNLTGGGDHSVAQIGHGGSLGTGNRDGAIRLVSTSGNLSMLSGAGLNAFTQIGHGGVGVAGNLGSSLVNGGIKVGIAGNILMNAGAGTDAYTQIGQGGVGAVGDHLGDICVTADGTIIFNNGLQGAGLRAYGQIGHGGYNAAGNHGGSITVVSGYVTAGGITMNGGSGDAQYVQIGHGGTNATGNLSGRVYTVADKGGDLVMSGGAGAGTYAMISHGDGNGAYGAFGSGTTGGTREGGIQTFVDGNAILNAGTGTDSNVHLIHRTNDSGGLNGVNYLGGDGYQYVVNGTSSSTNGTDHNNARENESTIIAGNFGTGNIVITNTGNLTLSNPLVPTAEYVNHSFSFIVLSTGNLNFERSFQNAGTGLVALVAGWDGVQDLSSINYNNGPCDPEIIPGSINFNDCDRYGNNNGVLTIGNASQTGPFAVGSRQGQTILRGYEINVVGSNTTAGGSTQIGFRADGSGDISGTINVRAKEGGLNLVAGSADNAFVQIGHGTGSGAFANNVTSAATISISFCDPADITVSGGGNGSFAMIGNGGGTGSYARGGNVTLSDFTGLTLTSGAGTGAYTQIGNGGSGGSGTVTGNVTLAGTGLVSLSGGGENAYARIGGGGLGHIGAISSNTSVTTTGGVAVSGGTGTNAYAQIGAGGADSVGVANALAGTTSVISTGGILSMAGGGGNGAYSQIGIGGLNADASSLVGATTVTIDGAIGLTGGGGSNSYVQIGSGGSGSDGTKGGDTTVSGTAATLTGGTGAGSNVLVGNGGGNIQTVNDAANGAITGNTSLTTTAGSVTMSAAGAAADNFVQIGAGGRNGVGTGNAVTSATTVTTTAGGLTMNAANAAYVQIGAGGQNADAASYTGNVLVNIDGAIAMSGGSGTNRYVHIGNGGNGVDAAKTGNTTVTGGSLLMTAGSGAGAGAQIGLGGGMDQGPNDFSNGVLEGNVLVTTTTDGVTLNAGPGGTQSYVQIGNGGLVASGNMNGTTTVNSAGAVSLTGGGGSNASSRIGAGGSGVTGTLTNAATTVTGTSLTMTGGSNSSAYTQIGAGGGVTGGGSLGNQNLTGNVEVTMSGAIQMSAGTGASAFAQIGAGGAGFNGLASTNSITSATLVSGASLSMSSNSGNGAYAQIGAGGGTTGFNAQAPLNAPAPTLGNITGNVSVTTTAGGVTMGALGSGTRAYVQIGAGGSGIDGGTASLGAANTITSPTTVNTTGGGVTLNSLQASYAQIGAGGLNADGTINGAVTVNADGALLLQGGAGTRRYAQIGNGGAQSNGAKSGAISVTAASVTLAGGTTERASAQIGHGGSDASGVVTAADILLNSIGAISLTSGGNQAYTQIGHGGFNALDLTVPNSSITLNSNAGTGTGDIVLTGGGGTNANAIIGHGGTRTDGNLNVGDVSATGAVTIARAANIRVNGGANTDSFAQIGHAGERATADFSGNISVTTVGLVEVRGGSAGTGAYGQIGHGGRLQTGTKTGTIIVSAAGPLSLLGGDAIGASAQIGHGGSTSAGNITGTIALAVNGGDIALRGGTLNETYAQIGHGGHLASGTFGGNVTVNFDLATQTVTAAAGSLTMAGGTGIGNDVYAQIGHGGSSNSTTTNAKSGNVVVAGVTAATLSGGTGTGQDNFVQIGHGGDQNNGGTSGSIGLLSTGPVALNGGTSGSDAYVQIGHGGQQALGNHGLAGDIITVAGLGVALQGGNGLRNYVQIGSGGFNADGDINGSVFVNVNPANGSPIGGGAVTLNGGNSDNTYAQIGIGGSGHDGSKNGNTTVRGDSVAVTAGSGGAAYAHLGAGSGIHADTVDRGSGVINTNTSVAATAGGITVSAAAGGAQAYAQIGGGGLIADGALSGNNAVSTTVTATGDVILTGGSVSNNYAMIGLGGSGSEGVKSLAGTSVTAASVTMTSGGGSAAFTQIGSGGGSTGGNKAASGAVTGTTTVTTTVGGVNLSSGGGLNAFSLIGNGGANLAGALTGATTVSSAAGVSLNSTSGGTGGFTQIGMGGFNADGIHTGATRVTAVGALALAGGGASDSYAQIGSGGSGSDNNKVDAGVSVRAASISLASGAGSSAYTQIGSGGGATGAGTATSGNAEGGVSAATTTGGISLLGGGDRAYSQIGHGGHGRSGSFSGDVQVVSAGDLGVGGGNIARAVALVGHGGITDALAPSAGTRAGNVLVRVDGATSVVDNASFAFISHIGAGGVLDGSRLALVTGTLDTTSSAAGVTGMIQNMIGAGSVEIGVTNGDLLVHGANVNANSGYHLDLVGSGDVTFLGGFQNAGAGSVNVVAGWDGSTGLVESINVLNPAPIAALSIEAASIFADPAAYTNNGGIVSIGDGTQTTAISVGSANGATNIFGDAVRLVAGAGGANLFSQIGYRGTTTAAINGAITVGSGAGGIDLGAGAQGGGFAQIGHGGAGASNAAVNANISLLFEGGDLTVAAGGGSGSYAQVGHGGTGYNAALVGNIVGTGMVGSLGVTGGSNMGAYAQIGHGGDAASGSRSGNIAFTAEDANVAGGDGFRAAAQIGHGGRSGLGSVAGAIGLTTTVGDLAVAGGTGGVAGAQIGHGGNTYNGTVSAQPITIDAAGSVRVVGGSALQSSALIGHGGVAASGSGFGGDIVVNAGQDLAVLGGSSLTAFAQVGHGGAQVTTTLSGDISVATGRDLTLRAPDSAASAAYAKIGHGDDMRGSFSAIGGSGNRDGDIQVAAGRHLTMQQSLIGHRNATSLANAIGTTMIGASWNNPANPNGGNLVADATSEFSGSEVRFYVPRRANNQIAAGAKMNGVAYTGGLSDPWPTKRADEYTIFWQKKSGMLAMNEHNSTFGSGPSPTTAGSFAFFFDTIVEGDLPVPPRPPAPPKPPVQPLPAFPDPLDDRAMDDWIREQERLFSGPGETGIFYEGYTHYGPNGEVIYDFNTAAGMASDDEEDVLRRQLEALDAAAEQAAAGSDGGAGSDGAE